MNLPERLSFMQTIPFFSEFDLEAVERLAAKAIPTRFVPGQIIIHEGEKDNRLFAIAEGDAGVYRLGKDGSENVISYVSAGAVVGELSLFDDAPRSASVKALDHVEALIFRREDFLSVIAEHPSACLGLLTLLTRRIREDTDLINALASQQTREIEPVNPGVISGAGADRVHFAKPDRIEDEALGVYLVSEGLLDRAQMILAMNRSLDSGSPLAQVLIRMKLIDSAALFAAEGRLARMRKVRSENPAMLIERLQAAGFLSRERADSLRKAGPDEAIDELEAELKITDEDVLNVVDLQEIPFRRINPEELSIELGLILPLNLVEAHRVIPLELEGSKLTLGMVAPEDAYGREMVAVATGYQIEPALLLSSNFAELKVRILSLSERAGRGTGRLMDRMHLLREMAGLVGRDRVEESGVLPLLEGVIRSAIRSRASDIHIEPQEERTRVRFRIDGILHDMITLPAESHGRTVGAIKAASEMDVANRNIPQDGKTVYDAEEGRYTIRVSTLPTVIGEKVVMRLHKETDVTLGLRDLGLTEKQYGQLTQLSKAPHGMVLVTGPVGSGKTTTLYSVLHSIDVLRTNVITIEDPIEYELPGVNHVEVNAKAGLTYVAGLRSILRQDPDVIMLGEIRDKETAQIATRAACTGVLMLTTLHTNDAPSAITALRHMDVEPFFIVNALLGVIAQRLVRIICERCSTQYSPESEVIASLGLDPAKEYHFRSIAGCAACGHSGYRGRIGIYEIMMMTPEIRDLILSNAPESDIRAQALNQGMNSLRHSAIMKVVEGKTTVDELLRKTAEVT